MDKTDLKILEKLDSNARISIISLAKNLRISKDIAHYRIKKLEEQRVIIDSHSIISPRKLGYVYHRLLLKFVPLNRDQEQHWMEWIKKCPQIIWVGVCDGEWNSIMTICTKNNVELNQTYNDLLMKFGSLILKKELIAIVEIQIFNRKFLNPEKKITYNLKSNFNDVEEKIDKKDILLIQEMRKDAKTRVVDLTKKINLSAVAISARLRQLEKKKIIIAYRPRIDYTKFGLQNYEVLISLRNPSHKTQIITYYQYHPYCETIIELMGHYDIQLTFLLPNPREFKNILADLRNQFSESIMEYHPLAADQEFSLSPIEGTKF